MSDHSRGHQQGLTGFSRLGTVVHDFLAWFLAIFVALTLRYEFAFDSIPITNGAMLALLTSSASLILGFMNHLYRNRYVVGSLDELRVLGITVFIVVAVCGSAAAFLFNGLGVPRSTLLIAAPLFLLLSGALRAYLRFARLRATGSLGKRKRALVFGAGDAAESLVPQLLKSPDSPYFPVVLIDDSPHRANRWICGVPMGGPWADLSKVVERYSVEAIIVAIPSADSELLSRVYADASALGLQVAVLPTLREYLGGRTTAGELRNVSIEDLLGRQSVQLDSELISRLIRGKRVVVTGAGGSIGSELSRQIADFEPELLTLVDRDETGLLLASMGVGSGRPDAACETFLADIRDREAVKFLFASRTPDVVFHAAALKHLPILESFPAEAWKTNVEGTRTILEYATESDAAVFVNISTDKAANPASVLGRSKKLGEELTAWFASASKKPYVSVRFGNVLGSRGSLIPVIAEQIASGGPVTITNKSATRYFMSIPEACQLVLQAAAQGEAGDVLVLDMGEPVNINDIAKRMIELSGRSIDIVYTGLRPGEKLHEDLLSDSEEPLPSSHPKIMRLKASPKSPEEVLAEKW